MDNKLHLTIRARKRDFEKSTVRNTELMASSAYLSARANVKLMFNKAEYVSSFAFQFSEENFLYHSSSFAVSIYRNAVYFSVKNKFANSLQKI